LVKRNRAGRVHIELISLYLYFTIKIYAEPPKKYKSKKQKENPLMPLIQNVKNNKIGLAKKTREDNKCITTTVEKHFWKNQK